MAHPTFLAPLCAAHMFDVQRLPPPGAKRLRGNEKNHVGPPTLGIEMKIVGNEDEIAAGRIKGEVRCLPASDNTRSVLLWWPVRAP